MQTTSPSQIDYVAWTALQDLALIAYVVLVIKLNNKTNPSEVIRQRANYKFAVANNNSTKLHYSRKNENFQII